MRGKFRGEGFFGFLQCGIRVGSGHGVEGCACALQQLAGLLHRDEGVVEGGRRGVIGDGANLFELLRHPCFDGGLIVGVLDLVEGRRLERQSAGRVERV